MTSPLIAFYTGYGKDSRGYTLNDILAWNDLQWEHDHSFIQWVFPLPEPSKFNLKAPLLSDEVIFQFRDNKIMQANMLRSIERAKQFYGAYRTDKKPHWLTPRNHNYLRMTRILRCLTALWFVNEAGRLNDWLHQLYDEELVGKETLAFWDNAIKL